MAVTYYVALPFIDSEDGPMPVAPVECQSPGEARRRAETMARDPKHVGAVAFQRSGEPSIGQFEPAVVLGSFGSVPENLDEL